MASKSVPASGEAELLIQGFRAGPATPVPYVFLGFVADDGTLGGFELSVEHANILGEYLRQEAEFAQTVREKGEE